MHSDVVNDVFYAELVMRGDILGLERRRRWDDDDKLAIVLSVGVDGATVTQVAQRHEVTRQQIYAWRHDLKKKGLLSAVVDAIFLPVEVGERSGLVAGPAAVDPVPSSALPIELLLANGRCLRFDRGLDTASLMRLIRAVEAA